MRVLPLARPGCDVMLAVLCVCSIGTLKVAVHGPLPALDPSVRNEKVLATSRADRKTSPDDKTK